MELLSEWLRLLQSTQILREIVLVLLIVAVAAGLARYLRRRHAADVSPLKGESARRLAFPLCAIVLLTLCSFVTHRFAWSGQVLRIAIELAIAMVGVRVLVFALRQIFAPSGALASFERSLATLIWFGVALNILGILPEFIDWLDSFSLHVGKGHVTVWQILQGLVTVFVTVILAMWLSGLADARLQAASSLDSSLRVVFSRLIKAVLLFVAVLLGMSLVGLDITTLSVFGGALGVGLGLGMQKIASNYVSGFIILLDRSIRIGNLIQVGSDQRGEVLQITTRYTVLRGGNGAHFIVPNEQLVSSVVQNENFSSGGLRMAIHLTVAHGSDLEQALRIAEEVAQAQPGVMAEPLARAFLSEVTDAGFRLELGVWVADPRSGMLETRSNILRTVLARFGAAGIELAQSQKLLAIAPSQTTPH